MFGLELWLIWAFLIALAVFLYVALDGFDLGIGILFVAVDGKEDRDVMMNTVAPVWDGNETWLVLGGAGLLAAFPLAYSVILSAFYLPLILMLVGLIFRGVAFEFRFKVPAGKRRMWDKAFAGGSLLATLCQGVTLGAFLNGIPMRDGAYAGGAFDWLTAFSVFVALALVVAYALLGSSWLVMKTEGPLQARMRRASGRLSWVLLAVIGAISVWTPLEHPAIADRWFSMPNFLWFAPVPVLVLAAFWNFHRALGRESSQATPFVMTLSIVFLGYSGLGISLWPNVIPPSTSIWAAAGPPQSLGFALVGALLIIPVILMYTAWSYWVFRGKVRHGDGYH